MVFLRCSVLSANKRVHFSLFFFKMTRNVILFYVFFSKMSSFSQVTITIFIKWYIFSNENIRNVINCKDNASNDKNYNGQTKNVSKICYFVSNDNLVWYILAMNSQIWPHEFNFSVGITWLDFSWNKLTWHSSQTYRMYISFFTVLLQFSCGKLWRSHGNTYEQMLLKSNTTWFQPTLWTYKNDCCPFFYVRKMILV